DARDPERAPAHADPLLAHAHPGARGLVRGVLAVPVELHLHAAPLVGVDLLARGAGDDRRLGAHDARLLRAARRPVRRPERHALDLVVVALRPAALAQLLRFVIVMDDARDEVLVVDADPRVPHQPEAGPWR